MGWDSNSKYGSWTIQVLQNIAGHPGTPAAEITASVDADKSWLKFQIRNLKELGSTESLSLGYRLSPRGKVVLRSIEGELNRAGQHR
jgi:predicted transcriptional regulator